MTQSIAARRFRCTAINDSQNRIEWVQSTHDIARSPACPQISAPQSGRRTGVRRLQTPVLTQSLSVSVFASCVGKHSLIRPSTSIEPRRPSAICQCEASKPRLAAVEVVRVRGFGILKCRSASRRCRSLKPAPVVCKLFVRGRAYSWGRFLAMRGFSQRRRVAKEIGDYSDQPATASSMAGSARRLSRTSAKCRRQP